MFQIFVNFQSFGPCIPSPTDVKFVVEESTKRDRRRWTVSLVNPQNGAAHGSNLHADRRVMGTLAADENNSAV